MCILSVFPFPYSHSPIPPSGADAEARGEAELDGWCLRSFELNEKQKEGEEANILKTFKKQNKKLACNPDFKLLVALGAPRSAFLAYFQPAGASNSLPGLKSNKKHKKT
jgi:hypothetical protein